MRIRFSCSILLGETMGKKLRLDVPTLLLNTEICKRNIEAMVTKAFTSNVEMRPHFKTHQSAEIGDWFRPFGVSKITVSSVDMAQYFASHGWEDITIAFPVNILEMEKINKLATDIQLNLLVESTETVEFLGENLTSRTDVLVKIDVGYGRTGINWVNFKQILPVADAIRNQEKLTMTGLLTHSGHSNAAHSKEEIRNIYLETVTRLNDVKTFLMKEGFSQIKISIGDTPTCSVMDEFTGVDEIRPGNFVLYDVMQLNLGTCKSFDIAVGVACPVVAKHEDRNEVIIYGGAIHFSKEFILQDAKRVFGYVTNLNDGGWGKPINGAYVSSLTQEHGVIKADHHLLNRIKIGDVLLILPVHSCLAVNLLREFITVDGDRIPTLLSC